MASFPSVELGVVMGLMMGGSLLGVVAGGTREAAREFLRRRRDRVAEGSIQNYDFDA